MVNYCCVYGCGRNSKTSKHLFYYGLPKERNRLVQWLEAIGREDLLERDLKKLTNRVCSRHFSPSSIKNKHLCADAVPTLCIPTNNFNEGSNDSDNNQPTSNDIICNSCKHPVFGFRYKCITCPDYDLCAKCEMFEAHAQHYILRIPKSENFAVADDLIKKWQNLFTAEKFKDVKYNLKEDSSDDDIPINKFIKNYDSGIDLSEEVKSKIRDEVDRVLNIKQTVNRKLKKKPLKKKKGHETVNMCVESGESESVNQEMAITTKLRNVAPELVFADVNDIKGNQSMDVKEEITNTLTTLEGPDPEQQIMDIKLNDDLSEFLIGVKYP